MPNALPPAAVSLAALPHAWNDTAVPYDRELRLDQLLGDALLRHSERIALGFEGRTLSYAELDRRSAALALRLRAAGAGPEVRVAIAAERSLELVIALVAVVRAGAGYVPIDPGYPAARRAFMLQDARPALTLGQQRHLDALPAGEGGVRIALDGEGIFESPSDVQLMPAPGLRPSSLVYVIYTSGSTGLPKGAINHHRGIVNRLLWMQDRYQLTPHDVVLQKTPFSFDVSVWEFFWPLLVGARLEIAQPEGHKDAAYLTHLIEREQVSVCHFVPSMLHSFLGEPGMAPRCRSLRHVICSGEALTRALQDRFFAQLECELHNLYGPTEAAVDVTHWTCRREWSEALVPIGQPIANTRIYVLGPDGAQLAVGEVGELFIAGVQVGRGYLNRDELTLQRFLPDPFAPAAERDDPHAPPQMYRSGDLARWRPDGIIEFLGRIDHQVKIGGVRIELGEIESALESHPRVQQAVALAQPGSGGAPRLLAYVAFAPGARPAPSELREWLVQRLPEVLVPSAIVALESFPLNSSGKVDRGALPAPTHERLLLGAAYEPLRGALEEFLGEQWANALQLEQIGALDSFFELGGNSILAADFTRVVVRELGAPITIAALFDAPSVRAYAALLERDFAAAVQARFAAPAASATGLPLAADAGAAAPLEFPLTDGQLELWLAARLSPDASRAFHVPLGVRLAGALDAAALERALGALVRRHGALRTRFAPDGERQRVAPAAPCALRRLDFSALSPVQRERALAEFEEADSEELFDLLGGPLLRAALIQLSEREHYLALTLHHIAADGWSRGVLLRDLGALYAAECGAPALAEPAPQYEVFAREQRRLAAERPQCEDYWLAQLGGTLPRLELPLDRPRPLAKTHAGAQASRVLGAAALGALRREAAQRKTTLFSLLLAGYSLLLKRLADCDDVIVGVATAGQLALGQRDLVGHCVNLLPIRCAVPREAPLAQHLDAVRRGVLEAQDQRDCSFGRLLQRLRLPREAGRMPLLSTFMTIQGAPAALEFGALGAQHQPREKRYCGFELELYVAEGAGELTLELHYNRDLFDAQTIASWLGQLETLLEAIGRGADASGAELSLLGAAEQRQLLELCAGPQLPYDREASLAALFERQVAQNPDAAALLWRGVRASYRELEQRSNRLARRLVALGVQRQTLVGLCLERSDALLVAMLAIHKAGGAYVPLDPAYPQQRIAYMLEDCGARVLLTQSSLRERLAGVARDAAVLCVDAEAAAIAALDAGPLDARSGGADLAYVMYTSGSTGRPKGVAVEHRSVAALIGWARELFCAADVRGVLATTSICFDLSVFEIFGTLCRGGAVILEDNALALAASERAGDVTLVNTVPSAIAELVRQHALPAGVRVVTLCGERLPAALVDQIYRELPRARVYDLYGPTEDTVYSTWTLREPGGLETIGRPMHNSQAYVLDARRALLPAGVPGELYLGGDGLARGYLGRPELSAERFVPSPFDPSGAARLYRTGDRARMLRDGRLIFLGRLDHQVKLRGYRIELGEIESALRACPQVREAVTAVREPRPGDARLCAYLVLQPGAELGAERLRAALRVSLPEYMVPAHFTALAVLPLTPNGKVDRAALPAPELVAAPVAAPAAAPVPVPAPAPAAREHELAALWAELLGVRVADPRADFFELGGHSLLAIQLIAEVNQRFGTRLSTTQFFGSPTLAGLSALLFPQGAATPAADAAASAGEAVVHGEPIAASGELADELGVAAPGPLGADLERVRLAIKEGRARPRSGPSRWMHESWIAKYLLAPLFAIPRGSVRRLIRWLILKLEGSEASSVTLRRLYAEHFDIRVGDYTVGAFEEGQIKPGTTVGRYSVITDTCRIESANHPLNTLSYHGLFYRACLGFSEEVEIPRKRIRIGSDVFIGHNASVLYPTEQIGDGAIIAAHAVVTFNVPPYAVVAGYPARIVRYRFSPEKIRELLELKWWEADLEELQPVREQFARPVEGKQLR